MPLGHRVLKLLKGPLCALFRMPDNMVDCELTRRLGGNEEVGALREQAALEDPGPDHVHQRHAHRLQQASHQGARVRVAVLGEGRQAVNDGAALRSGEKG